jgi:hypothetical protein
MTASMARIDWLSFTMPIRSDNDDWDVRASVLRQRIDEITDRVLSVYAGDLLPGRQPYWWSIGGVGIRVFFGRVGDALVEISGEGCELLHDAGVMRSIVQGWRGRITRLDHATDILTDTLPVDFVEQSGRKFRSKSVITSPTGQTVYCGSLKSNRYCRVYRYTEPHPRAHLLRVECVFRKGDAGIAADAWLESGDAVFSGRCGAIYKWQHADWTNQQYEKLPGWKADTKGGKTEAWLIKQVAPALRKALSSEQMDKMAARRFLMAVWSTEEIRTMFSDQRQKSIVESVEKSCGDRMPIQQELMNTGDGSASVDSSVNGSSGNTI